MVTNIADLSVCVVMVISIAHAHEQCMWKTSGQSAGMGKNEDCADLNIVLLHHVWKVPQAMTVTMCSTFWDIRFCRCYGINMFELIMRRQLIMFYYSGLECASEMLSMLSHKPTSWKCWWCRHRCDDGRRCIKKVLNTTVLVLQWTVGLSQIC